ncbi:MAG: hypothetical protein LBJ78_04275 [Puniceicoccales bacterium]|nr:hypothetical protein [Puniceicoccales bacterium]
MNDPIGLRNLADELNGYGLKPGQVQQIVKMLESQSGTAFPTHIINNANIPYSPISQHRLLDIILHVTMFEDGIQQLLNLAELCQCNGLHLCFLQHEKYCINASYPQKIDNIDHKMLYIMLPEDPETFCREASLNKATMVNGELQIERVKLMELLRSFDKVDGYLVGHELSHAIAFAICCNLVPEDLGNAARDTHRKIKTFFNAICQQLTPEAAALLHEHTEILTSLLRGALFQDGDEARNVLGLEINESFDRGNEWIISEYDFLCELTDYKHTHQLHIRMPYSPNRPTSSPKICMALLALIFILKEQSLTDSNVKIDLPDPVMQKLKATLEEFATAKQNAEMIRQQLNGSGYKVQFILGDGNDGFYAILDALTPSDGLMSPLL